MSLGILRQMRVQCGWNLYDSTNVYRILLLLLDYEVTIAVHHYLLFIFDVLLLPGINDVSFLQDFHRVRSRRVTFQLNLNNKTTSVKNTGKYLQDIHV